MIEVFSGFISPAMLEVPVWTDSLLPHFCVELAFESVHVEPEFFMLD